MQYLEIKPEKVEISPYMPARLLTMAIGLIESSEFYLEDKEIEINFQDGYLSMSGKGIISDLYPLIQGIDIIRPYLMNKSGIEIHYAEDGRCEVTVELVH